MADTIQENPGADGTSDEKIDKPEAVVTDVKDKPDSILKPAPVEAQAAPRKGGRRWR